MPGVFGWKKSRDVKQLTCCSFRKQTPRRKKNKERDKNKGPKESQKEREEGRTELAGTCSRNQRARPEKQETFEKKKSGEFPNA